MHSLTIHGSHAGMPAHQHYLESPDSINEWQDATFGAETRTPLAVATRMNVEVAELIKELTLGLPEGHPMISLAHANVWLAETLSAQANQLPKDLEVRADDWVASFRARVGKECSDVFVVLCGVAKAAGIDLFRFVDSTMTKNRARLWKQTPGGRFQHVEGT